MSRRASVLIAAVVSSVLTLPSSAVAGIDHAGSGSTSVTLRVDDVTLRHENGFDPVPFVWDVVGMPTDESGHDSGWCGEGRVTGPGNSVVDDDSVGNRDYWGTCWTPQGSSEGRRIGSHGVNSATVRPGRHVFTGQFSYTGTDGSDRGLDLVVAFTIRRSAVEFRKTGSRRWVLQGVDRSVVWNTCNVQLQKKVRGHWKTIWYSNPQSRKKNESGRFTVPKLPRGHYRLVHKGGSASKPVTRIVKQP